MEKDNIGYYLHRAAERVSNLHNYVMPQDIKRNLIYFSGRVFINMKKVEIITRTLRVHNNHMKKN